MFFSKDDLLNVARLVRENAGAAELLVKLTTTKIDDYLVAALVRIAENEELLETIYDWLTWFDRDPQNAQSNEPPLPEAFGDIAPAMRALQSKMTLASMGS